MTRSGLPDYGMYAALENMGNLVDYGELAARLGSIVTFNREGNIVFWDDFEGTPFKWVESVEGGGGIAKYSSEQAFSGGQSLKLVTGTSLGSNVSIHRYFPRLISGKLGIEIGFKPSTANYYFDVHFMTNYDDYWYDGEIRIDISNEDIYFLNENSDYQLLVENVNIASRDYLFHVLKLVIDTDTKKYERLIYDRKEYNMSDYAMKPQIFPSDHYHKVKFTAETREEASVELYLDNFILTQNEP